ncbi:MAG TPA: WYL domain-containing protein [Solirubrobacterales bacterium]
MNNEGGVTEKLRTDLLAAIGEKKDITLFYEREGSATGFRTAAPHALFRSTDNRLFLHAFQHEGASTRGGLPAWRRFALESIVATETSDSEFAIREDYDPASKAYSAGLIASVY